MSPPCCRRPFATLVMFCFLWLATGCVPRPYRTDPQFKAKIQEVRKLALVEPVVEVHEVSAAGYVYPRRDLSASARKPLKQAFRQAFEEKHYQVKSLNVGRGFEKEISEVRLVYKLVNKSILLHSYGPQVFPEKTRSFGYGLGSIERIAKADGVDCLVFVTGYKQISETKQKAYMSAAVVILSCIFPRR